MSTTEKLIQFIQSDIKGDAAKITEDTSLFKEGILSSLDLVSLLDFIEKELKFKVPSEDVDFENFDSVRALSTYIDSKK